jgi:hypothetical protein
VRHTGRKERKAQEVKFDAFTDGGLKNIFFAITRKVALRCI